MVEKVLAGKYELREQIGEGGSGIVYLAWDRHLERFVAVKSEKIPEGFKESGILRGEMEMLKTLKHPMLPAVYDYFFEDSWYLVMEYIKGESLYDYIESEGSIPEEQVCEWTLQLLSLFSYLHTQKPPVIYRDLKPRNIMVCPDGNLRVVDFGAAFLIYYDKQNQKNLAGTVGYAAPEQLGAPNGSDGKVDERSDIYTLGATLYHMLTGFDPSLPPYGIRPIRCVNPALTSGIEWIVKKCTEAEPSRRYQSVEEVKKDLLRKETLGRRYRFRRMGKKEQYVIRKMEKKIWLTEKKTTGLLGICIFICSALIVEFSISAMGREAPLPVIVYNSQGQKLVIRYDSIYIPEDNLIFELEKELFTNESLQELSVSLTNCETGEKRERIFYIQGAE